MNANESSDLSYILQSCHGTSLAKWPQKPSLHSTAKSERCTGHPPRLEATVAVRAPPEPFLTPKTSFGWLPNPSMASNRFVPPPWLAGTQRVAQVSFHLGTEGFKMHQREDFFHLSQLRRVQLEPLVSFGSQSRTRTFDSNERKRSLSCTSLTAHSCTFDSSSGDGQEQSSEVDNCEQFTRSTRATTKCSHNRVQQARA